MRLKHRFPDPAGAGAPSPSAGGAARAAVTGRERSADSRRRRDAAAAVGKNDGMTFYEREAGRSDNILYKLYKNFRDSAQI